ncbi:MAG: hypothetical protein ACTHON_15025 [Humibacter sp.]
MTTWSFTPPVIDEAPAGQGRLLVRYKLTRGVSILEGPPGTFREARYPSQDEVAASQPHFFQGGHVYDVDDDLKAALIAAGIGVTDANFSTSEIQVRPGFGAGGFGEGGFGI